MKTYRTTVLFTVFALLAFSAVSYTQPLFNRAPEVLPGTDPQWRNPSYWIRQMISPDEVVLTVEEIMRMNADFYAKLEQPDPYAGLQKERIPNLMHWWPGWVEPVAPNLSEMTSVQVADLARERISIQKEYLRSQAYGNYNNIEYSEADIRAFEDEMAENAIGSELTIRNGLAVRTVRMRNVPTFIPFEPGMTTSGERRYDMFNICMVKIGMPVTVMHVSKSGEFLLALSEDAFGWVRAEDIAFGGEAGIRKFADPVDFVVCTGDRVMYYADEACTIASGWFRMGDRLPHGESDEPRHIMVPVRMTNGQLIFETAWITEDAQVHEGYVPYTRRNVVEIAFRLLDNAYDFTGGHFGRNHETTYRDIFACFGFRLPWHGALFTLFGDNPHNADVAMPDTDNNNKGQFATILSHEPFLSLHTAGGHPQLLLGRTADNVPIVFDHNGYEYKENDTVYKVRRTCVGPMTTPGVTAYMLRRPLTTLELK